MNKIKTVLDREQVSSDLIQSKQDFGKVLSGAKVSGPGFWKTSWFYGVVGTASIVLTVTVISLDSISQATPVESRTNEQDQVLASKSESLPDQEKTSVDEVVADQTTEVPDVDQKDSPDQPEVMTATVNTVENEVVHDEQAEVVAEELVASNTNPESEKRTVYNSMMPHFGDVYSTEITVDQLCGSKLLCNDEWAVTSFKVQFYNWNRSVEQHIRGNKIPYDFCELFPESGTFMLFVTNIMAENRSTGKVTQLTSMNLKATN